MTNGARTCPFCGSRDLIITRQIGDRNGIPTCIRCDNCGSCGPVEYLKEDQLGNIGLVADLTGWNRRP
jgi:transcription elongation factor Elf1